MKKYLISLLSVCVLSIGYCGQSTTKDVKWDIRKSRNVTLLSGGKWTPETKELEDASYVYHIDGNRLGAFELALPGDEVYMFDDVANVYVHREGKYITEIHVASVGYSQEEAIEKVRRLHRDHRGEGVNKLEEWLQDVERHSLSSYDSTLRDRPNGEGIIITASIVFNFGGELSRWYVLVSYDLRARPKR